MTDKRVADIGVVAIDLEIDSKKVFFLLLASDGLVNRMGSGSLSTADGVMFIGVARPALLPEALKALSDDMLKFTGGYDVPEKRGAPCKLSIVLKFCDGSEDGFGFTYGSESQGPPSEIVRFVQAALAATEPWYQEQRRLTGKTAAPNIPAPEPARRPWWRFW